MATGRQMRGVALLIARDLIDDEYVRAHTVGFDELRETTAHCTEQWASEICGLPAADISRAAELFGAARRILSTVLQGVYQSH